MAVPRSKSVLVVAILVALAAAGAAAALPATASAAPSSVHMLRQINAVRAAHGLPALRTSRVLRQGAYRHSRSMLVYGYFGHAARRTRLPARAEIIERHSGEAPRVRYALRAWLRSPGHLRVILDRKLRYAGAGVSTWRGSTAWTVRFR